MMFPERGEIALERGIRAHVGHVFEPRAAFVAELAQIHKDGRAGILSHQREREHHRSVRNVAAADVEEPRHRMRIGDHQRVGGGFFHLRADPRELRGGVLAGKAQIVRHDRPERRLRAVAPHCIDRIVVNRNETGARRRAGFRQPLGAVNGVQPR